MSLVASAHVDGAVDGDAVPSQRTTGKEKVVDAGAGQWRNTQGGALVAIGKSAALAALATAIAAATRIASIPDLSIAGP